MIGHNFSPISKVVANVKDKTNVGQTFRPMLQGQKVLHHDKVRHQKNTCNHQVPAINWGGGQAMSHRGGRG